MAEENLIDAVCDRIKFDRDTLKGEGLQRVEVDSFNLSEFWPQFESAVQALSNEVTKVGVLCNSKPFPKMAEVGSMMSDVLQYYNMMRDLYLVLPEEVGAEVFKATTTVVLNIMTALHATVHSFHDLSDKGSKDRLVLTSTLWDACHAVQSLPRNNLLATRKLVEGESALASDALDELMTVNKNDNKITAECDKSKRDSESSLKKSALGRKPTESNMAGLSTSFEISSGGDDIKSKKNDQISASQTTSEKGNQGPSESADNEISENDRNIVKNWVTGLHSRNVSADFAILQRQITTANTDLTELERNISLNVFPGSTYHETLRRQAHLKISIAESLSIKNILERSSEIVNNDKGSKCTEGTKVHYHKAQSTHSLTANVQRGLHEELEISSDFYNWSDLLQQNRVRLELAQQAGQVPPNPVVAQRSELGQQAGQVALNLFVAQRSELGQQAGQVAPNPVVAQRSELGQQAGQVAPNPFVAQRSELGQQAGQVAPNPVVAQRSELGQQAGQSAPNPADIPLTGHKELWNWRSGTLAKNKDSPADLATVQNDINKVSGLVQQSLEDEPLVDYRYKKQHRRRRTKLIKKLKKLFVAKQELDASLAKGTILNGLPSHVEPTVAVKQKGLSKTPLKVKATGTSPSSINSRNYLQRAILIQDSTSTSHPSTVPRAVVESKPFNHLSHKRPISPANSFHGEMPTKKKI